MNLEKALNDLMIENEAKKKAIIAEYEILQTIAEKVPTILEYEKPFIHYFELYGSVGSIYFRSPYSFQKEKQVDKKLFNDLLEAFPPIACIIVKDSCTSIKPDINDIGETLENKGKEISDIYGIFAYIDLLQNHTVKFEWYSMIKGACWNIEISFPLSQVKDFVKVDLLYDCNRRTGERLKLAKCDIYCLQASFSYIKWSNGHDRLVPNNFTVYTDIDTGRETNFVDFIVDSAICPKCNKQVNESLKKDIIYTGYEYQENENNEFVCNACKFIFGK